MKHLILATMATAGLAIGAADVAQAQVRVRIGSRPYYHSGYRSSHYHSAYPYSSRYYGGYRTPHYHRGHYDYHPGYHVRHGNHYDYIPGHYHYHRGHWHY